MVAKAVGSPCARQLAHASRKEAMSAVASGHVLKSSYCAITAARSRLAFGPENLRASGELEVRLARMHWANFPRDHLARSRHARRTSPGGCDGPIGIMRFSPIRKAISSGAQYTEPDNAVKPRRVISSNLTLHLAPTLHYAAQSHCGISVPLTPLTTVDLRPDVWDSKIGDFLSQPRSHDISS